MAWRLHLKPERCRKCLGAAALLAAGAVMVILYMAFTADHARLEYRFDPPLVKVSLQGRFRVGNGEWHAYPPENMDALRAVGEETVEFEGHCVPGIPKGQTIFVYVRHVLAEVAVNGSRVFAVGQGDSPSFTRSPGNFWAGLSSPGITAADTLSISVQQVEADSHPYQIELFLEKIQYGGVWELLKTEADKVMWAIPLGVLYITMAFLLVILTILFVWHRETKFALQAAYLTGIYISVGLWTMVGYELLSLLLPFPTVIVVWEMYSMLLSAVFIVLYISTLLTEWRHTAALSVVLALCMVIFLTAVLQLAGRMELFAIQTQLQMVTLAAIILCLCLSFAERKVADKEAIRVFMTFIPLCVLAVIDLIISTFGPFTNGIFACTGFLITSVLQLFLLMKAAYTKMEQAGRLEREVLESRVAVSLSQIQPHFLYNILTGIQYLCSEDPVKAEQAVTDFTMFLRGNLDSLSRNTPILLSQEMEHVQHYLALAQLRYGNRLHVEWNLGPVNILVPALSVQPLVENAVRWGMRDSGITVRITTKKTEKGHVITVEDNGKGFDPHAKQPPKGTGIGLASIRTRVCDIYDGSLTIDSQPGKGTVTTLVFPLNVRMKRS